MEKNKISVADYLQRLDERQARMEAMLLSQKTVLTFDEAAKYTGLSKSYLYKLTSTGGIPCYKPRSKMIYMEKGELNSWLLQNRNVTLEEAETEASTLLTLKKV